MVFSVIIVNTSSYVFIFSGERWGQWAFWFMNVYPSPILVVYEVTRVFVILNKLMVYGVIGQHGHPARARVGAEPKASHVTAITLRQLMVETTALEIALKT